MAGLGNYLPDIPASIMVKGVEPNHLKAAFSDKVSGILGNGNTITRRVKSSIKKSVHTVILHVGLRENKDKSVDRRRRSTESYQAVGALSSTTDGPSLLQELTQGKQGITKFSKETTKAYHVAQDCLFSYLEIVVPKDISTKDFCNLIDGVTKDHAKELFNTPSDLVNYRKRLIDLVEKCRNVLTLRIAGDWAVENDLMTLESWRVWRDHMDVIVSYGALLVVLDMLCVSHYSNSYLSQ